MRAMLPLLAALLLAPLLPGCAGGGAPISAQAPGQKPAGPMAQALVKAVEGEWRAWGRIQVDGWPVALEQVPDATPELFDRLMGYWSATPEGPAVVAAHLHYRETMASPMLASASLDPVSGLPFNVVPANVTVTAYNHPAWSAAFISYAMGRAGIGRGDFDPSASHALYVDRLIERAAYDPPGAAFLPRSPAEYSPRPGDLVCADRSAVPLQDWRERMDEPGRFRPMHCDVVVRAGGGTADLIGGNVLDVVLRRRIPTDSEGRLLPPPFDRPPFFVVFEARR